jgi:hypothetical protein
MIPQELQKMILKGKARQRSVSTGFGALSRIRIPDNTSAFVVGFDYFPFMDGLTAVMDPWSADQLRVHDLQIYSKDNFNNWMVRDDAQIVTSGTAGVFHVNPGQPYQVHGLMIPHDSDIFVNLNRLPNVSLRSVNYGPLQDTGAPIKRVPNSYGQGAGGLNAVDEAIISSSGKLFPPGRESVPVEALAPREYDMDNFFIPNTAESELEVPSTSAFEQSNTTFPLVNVHLVQLNQKLDTIEW